MISRKKLQNKSKNDLINIIFAYQSKLNTKERKVNALTNDIIDKTNAYKSLQNDFNDAYNDYVDTVYKKNCIITTLIICIAILIFILLYVIL